jgi:hypothetical protein
MYSKKCFVFAFLLCLTIGAAISITAQQNPQYAVERAQNAVRDRINTDRGNNVDVTFPEWQRAQTYYVSNSLTGVRGEGMYAWRNDYRRTERFTYDVVVNVRNGRIDRLSYRNVSGNDSPNNDDNYNVPNWAVGTFIGRSPSRNRRQSTLVIGRSGNVSLTYDRGRPDYGTYQNSEITFQNFTWTVDRNGRDIRVRDLQTNRSERFRRNSDWDGDDDYNTNVPRWMVGVFRGTTESEEIELSISPDGAAQARSLRNNITSSGRYSNGVLTFEFGSYEIRRESNGIRTININNRSNQTYYQKVN